jgi:uncharacterized cofD-like protein
MRVKRWLLLVPIGVFLVVAGVALLVNVNIFTYVNTVSDIALRRFGVVLNTPKTYVPVSLGAIFFGLVLIFISIRQVIGSITSVVSPETQDRLADLVYQRRYLAQGQRIVVIGGGTGLSTMLRGLKEQTSNIVAIVTVTDDGGSSGALHRELGMLPPGDIRNCLVALADAEPLMTELFQYRFNGGGGGGLHGHSFGNLLIAAMTNITGDFEKAVKETSRVLAIRGRVLPSTVDNVALCAEMEDGSLIDGETSIADSPLAVRHIFLQPSDVKPLEESIRAIEYADAIVIGPGSVYTSIIPNLLVHGIVDAIVGSDAVKIYVCNVMTQPGETIGYSACDHVQAVIDHAQQRVFSHVLVNREVPNRELLQKYAGAGAELVKPEVDRIREMGFRPVVGNYISQTDVVRHDPRKLAEAIFRLMY